MDDVSTSATGQVPVTQCGESEAESRARDRMKPIEGKLTWIPIGSGQHPKSDDHLAYWNPCDGCGFGYWDESEGFMEGHPFTRTFANGQPGREDSTPIGKECGGYTHYAVLNGPADPNHDISHNWKLYNEGYKTPSDAAYEAAQRLAAATGLDHLDCWAVLDECAGDEARALEKLKVAGGAS